MKTPSPTGVKLVGDRRLVEVLYRYLDGKITLAQIQCEDPALPYDRHLNFTRQKFLALPKRTAPPEIEAKVFGRS
jgi:hypothetical protein